MLLRIKSDSAAGRVISALTDKNGPAELYVSTLNSLLDILIYHSDAFGLSDCDAMELIRVVALIRLDIQSLSKADVVVCPDSFDEIPANWSELSVWSKVAAEAAEEINQRTPSALAPEIRNLMMQLNKLLNMVAVNGYNQPKTDLEE